MSSVFIDLPVFDQGSPGSVDSFNGRTGVVVSQSGDYTASQITNVISGNISATDVQAAINELDAEKSSKQLPTVTRTANANITTADGIIFCDTNSVGAFNLQLPDPATVTGQIFRIVDSKGTFNTNAVTLVRFGSESISGLAANRDLQANWGMYQLISNGTDWFLG